MKKSVFILLLSLLLFECNRPSIVSLVKEYAVGETKISIIETCHYPCHPGVLFINLHSNENTSLKAAGEYLRKIGGRLINIKNNGERLVNFTHAGSTYTFDPNRIYSPAGIDTTITILSARYDTNAAAAVSKFSRSIIDDYINNSNLIISLHNNRDSTLSVLTYKNDTGIINNPGKAFVNPAMDVDDFILTTDIILFNRIKEKNINVVWENSDSVKDDSSLSVYAARHNIPYINVEAEHEHFREQLFMLQVLEDIIKQYRRDLKT